MHNVFFFTIGVKVLKKSILYTCENFYTTNLILNLAIDLLRWYFSFNTYYNLIAFCLGENTLYFHV